MAIGLRERIETVLGRTDRLTAGAEYWLKLALKRLGEGSVEDALDATRDAQRELLTLRKHLTGRDV